MQGSISHPGDGIAIATAIVNTALGTSAAGLSTLIFNKTGIIPGTGGYYSFLMTMNGSLTGDYLIFSHSAYLWFLSGSGHNHFSLCFALWRKKGRKAKASQGYPIFNISFLRKGTLSVVADVGNDGASRASFQGFYLIFKPVLMSSSGTVALCAGCNVYDAWAAVVVGALSGPLFLYFNYVLLRLRIDDPLDAIPVHGVGGVWGTLCVYIFKKDGDEKF